MKNIYSIKIRIKHQLDVWYICQQKKKNWHCLCCPKCCRKYIKTNNSNWTAVKRILRYLNDTIFHGLLHGDTGSLIGYSDAKWTCDIDDLNDTHREELCFTQFSTKMATWLLLTFFICLHNQLSLMQSVITY